MHFLGGPLSAVGGNGLNKFSNTKDKNVVDNLINYLSIPSCQLSVYYIKNNLGIYSAIFGNNKYYINKSVIKTEIMSSWRMAGLKYE